MDLAGIMEKCDDFNVYEQRYNAEDYKELVFFINDIDQWTKVFEEALGPAEKPSGTKPSTEHLKITENFGGINKHQTLFQKNNGGCIVIAMLWPWSDNEHITLKMAVLK